MGEKKDGIIGLVLIAVIIVIIVGVVVWAIGPGETKPVEQDKSTNTPKESANMEEVPSSQQANVRMDTEEEVLEFIKNYRGEDNSGNTLMEMLGMLIATAYPGERILQNPSTIGGLSAVPLDVSGGVIRNWGVEFSLQTYRESISFEWIVDTETNTVYAKNEVGKSILDGLDAFD